MIKIIVAYDKKFGIGFKNNLPWHLPDELKWVSKLTRTVKDPTKKNAIIMGRRTWDSIPEKRRPLYERLNIVISKNIQIINENVMVFNSFEDFMNNISQLKNIENFFIFGGETIYKQSLELEIVDEIIATEIEKEFEADVFFPLIPKYFNKYHIETVYHNNLKLNRMIYRKY